jgi:hypothetical protein
MTEIDLENNNKKELSSTVLSSRSRTARQMAAVWYCCFKFVFVQPASAALTILDLANIFE